MNDAFRLSDKTASGVGKGFKSEIGLVGYLKVELFDKEGNIKEICEINNTVTTAGKYGVMDQIIVSPTLEKPGWMELGSSTPTSTLLGSYISGSRVALTSKTRANNVITMVGDWGAGVGTGAITEAGVFDVVTQNTVNMWLSASFSVINKGDNDTLKITWTLTGN